MLRETRRAIRLRTYIVMLVVATLAPVTIFGFGLGLLDPIRTQAAILDRMSSTAKGLSLALDRQIGMSVTALEALATSPQFQAGDFAAFREQVDRYLSTHPGWMLVVDRTGQQRMNTVVPPGATLPQTANRELLRQVFAAKNVYVSNAISGTILKQLIVVVSIHVPTQAADLVMSYMIPLGTLTHLLQEQGLPKGWIGVVADRDSTILARTQMPEMIGKPMTIRVNGPGHIVSTVSHEGIPVYFAWTTSSVSGWSTGIAVPTSLINATLYQRFGVLSAAGLAAVLLAVIFAALFSRRVIRPLTSLAHAVADSAAPDNNLFINSGVLELDTLAKAFRTKLTELVAAGDARERVEAGLREREATLHDLVQTLDLAAIMIRDWSGTITFWSRGCEELYGWRANEVIGRKADDVFQTAYPLGKAELKSILVRDGTWTGDLTQRRRDCETIVVAVHKVVQRADSGLPVAVLESFSDVSTLRRTQRELKELNQSLEDRVREEVVAREAAQARAAHAERMQALGQLAGGIAHDINNVLQAVTGGAALIERRPADAEAVRRFARMILDAGMRGSSVTQRLLVFASRSDLRAEPIDAENLLVGVQELLSHTLGSTIAISLAVPDEPCRLVADRAQLETVLLNLATNARDAMPGGGTITFSCFKEHVTEASNHVAGLRPGVYIAIAVTDTGVGMDQATLARASEPFFTTKGQGRGTGLGLAMARGFAGQSGGGLHIDSVLHEGTTVTIWLPEAAVHGDGVAPTGEDHAGRLPAQGPERRVLLVDDDTLVRESIAMQLEAAGYTVVSVGSGPEALATINAGERFDCIVTDLSMPNMDGLALIRLVHQKRPNLPTVLLTGYATDSTGLAIGGAMSGTFSLLRKPVSGNELADRIAGLISMPAET